MNMNTVSPINTPRFGATLIRKAKQGNGGRLVVVPAKGNKPQRLVRLDQDVTIPDRYSRNDQRAKDKHQPVAETVIDTRLKTWIREAKQQNDGQNLSKHHPAIKAWRRFVQSAFDRARQARQTV